MLFGKHIEELDGTAPELRGDVLELQEKEVAVIPVTTRVGGAR
jgi:hypothetical protein